MKVIVCLDDTHGMIFNNRRQSRDRRVIDDILTTVGNERLYISGFSEKLFAERTEVYSVSENMLSEAEGADYCFVENIPLAPYASRIEELVIYRWNRRYPADTYFDIDLEKEGFALVSTMDFEGYSHEKITKEIFKR